MSAVDWPALAQAVSVSASRDVLKKVRRETAELHRGALLHHQKTSIAGFPHAVPVCDFLTIRLVSEHERRIRRKKKCRQADGDWDGPVSQK
jgi:hypothetical protein